MHSTTGYFAMVIDIGHSLHHVCDAISLGLVWTNDINCIILSGIFYSYLLRYIGSKTTRKDDAINLH